MNKTIKSYEDLLLEEQRLTAQLAAYKGLIGEDIAGVKIAAGESLNPLRKVKTTIHNLFVHDGRIGPALNFALNFVLDFFIRLFIPKRTSVWTKTIIPFITKNYVSHLITDEQRAAVSKFVNEAVGKVDAMIRKSMLKKQEQQFEHMATPNVNPQPAAGA